MVPWVSGDCRWCVVEIVSSAIRTVPFGTSDDELSPYGTIFRNSSYNIIIIVTSFAPISSKIKLSGATKPGD